ncbi:hypothetical protein J7E70_15880 [Variovorax paradoxus]|nr:hypothetical protein [Variovorax paradoxus]MBT2301942.1 hypothetical protein [Variovorax paradoxus]
MDTSANGMRAAIKALKETVAPAVDPANPLANEQLRLACSYLALVADRLSWREQRLRRELDQACALAGSVQAHAAGSPPEVLDALGRGVAAAHDLQTRSSAAEADVVAATQGLQAAVSALVRCARSLPASQGPAIERAVLEASRAWLDTRRAWFRPLGFDKEAEALPTLESILRER